MRGSGILGLAGLLCASPSFTESGPTAEKIVRQHIEAIGGAERLRAVRSLKKTGIYVYNGMEHPIVSYHSVGRKCREEIEGLKLWGTAVWEGHTVLRGTNGSVAWIKDDSRPSEWQGIPNATAKLMLEEADLHGALYEYEEKGHQVKLSGRGDVDGTPAYLLEVTLASGVVQTWYLDSGSLLLLRKEIVTEEGERGPGALERPRAWHFDDYRPVEGVMMPFWVYVEEPLFAREYTFETIEANVTIDDALFEPPPGSFESRRAP
jgi:hypothetical protein